jgi:hypothetical protein
MEQTECSEMSAYKIQTPGNYPEESIQHSEHGESFKSRNPFCFIHISLRITSRVKEKAPNLKCVLRHLND